jgi:endonuclease/exonuclease/phosphatase (EEP) superfamily protein YafD
VHTEWFSDPSKQITYIADQIRERFSEGPLVVVGDFNMPQENTTRPYDTALRSMVEGTGLTAAGGVLDPDVEMPLPRTEFISGLHLDYIFYRGLELESTFILSEYDCSDHMPIVAKFHHPSSIVANP